MKRTEVEEVETVVLFFDRVGFCIATPNDEDIADESTGMTDAGAGDFAGCLEESCRVFAGGKEVEIVSRALSDETAKEIEFAVDGGGGREGMAVAGKGTWGRGCRRDYGGLVEDDGWRENETTGRPGICGALRGI